MLETSERTVRNYHLTLSNQINQPGFLDSIEFKYRFAGIVKDSYLGDWVLIELKDSELKEEGIKNLASIIATLKERNLNLALRLNGWKAHSEIKRANLLKHFKNEFFTDRQVRNRFSRFVFSHH